MPLRVESGPDIFYTREYEILIRSNKAYLLSLCTEIPITRLDLLMANRTDFYRFISYYPDYETPLYLRWTIAFLNGIDNPRQDISQLKKFLMIDEAVINKLIIKSQSEHK